MLKLFLCLALVSIALACGGADSDPSVATSTISIDGSINETGNNLKPRSAASNPSFLIGKVEYLDTKLPSSYISFTGSALNFKATALVSKPFYLKVYAAADTSRVYMSRYFAGNSHNIQGANAQLNVITTEQAMRIQNYLSNNPSAIDATAFSKVNLDMFDEASFSLFGLNFNSLYNSLTIAFKSFIDQRVSNLSSFNPESPSNYFSNYDSTSAASVIEYNESATPSNATPGVLFAYDFPRATSTLSNESVTYSATLTDGANLLFVSMDTTNRTVKFIPDSSSLGQTLTLSIVANAGDETSATLNKFIAVKSLQLDAPTGSRIQLGGSGSNGYHFSYGPLIDGENFYVIAEKNGSYHLESYLLSDIQVPNAFGSSTAAPADLQNSYPMARSFSDVIIKNDIAYIVDFISGVVKFDLTALATSNFSSQTSPFTATTLAHVGETLLVFNDDSDSFASLDISSLSSDLNYNLDLAESDNLNIDSIGSLGNIFYISGQASGNYITNFYTEDFDYLNSIETHHHYLFSKNQSGLQQLIYGISDSTPVTVSLLFSGANLTITEHQNSLASEAFSKPFINNGSTLLTYDANHSAKAYSLISSKTFEQTAFDNEPVTFIHNSTTKAIATIVNLPEGNTANPLKSVLYLPGTQNNTNTWYIKGYELTPLP